MTKIYEECEQERKINIAYSKTQMAVEFLADAKDFDPEGDLQLSWQEAYFKLLTWKNTWDIALQLDIIVTNKGTCVKLIVPAKETIPDMTAEMLTDLGYRNVLRRDIKVFVVEPDCEDDIDFYYFDQ